MSDPFEETYLQMFDAGNIDLTSKLIYADWLDERDDPRGALLRAITEMESRQFGDASFDATREIIQQSRDKCLSADKVHATGWLERIGHVWSRQNMDADQLSKILSRHRRVVLEFSARWNGPSRMMVPVMTAGAAILEGWAVVGDIDIDEHGPVAQAYGIVSIPTLKFLVDGEVVASQIGLIDEERLHELVREAWC